jgi:hypothetical protein
MKNISLALSALIFKTKDRAPRATEDVALDMEKAVRQAAQERAC